MIYDKNLFDVDKVKQNKKAMFLVNAIWYVKKALEWILMPFEIVLVILAGIFTLLEDALEDIPDFNQWKALYYTCKLFHIYDAVKKDE